MKYERIRTIAQVLSALQTHKIGSLGQAHPYIRVTYTHQVCGHEKQNFDALAAFLVNNYEMLTPDQFFQWMANPAPLSSSKVLMTFDDGLISSYQAIKTTLAKYNLKAVMFIPTQILELKTPEDMKRFAWRQLNFQEGEPPASFSEDEYLTMGKKEILDLQKDGHAIYPHTHSHRRLHEITDDATAAAELSRPKKILEDLLQAPMDAFAYPVGTERVIGPFAFSYLKKTYRYGFTALAGKNTARTDPYLLHRDCMNANYDVDHLKRVQQGVLDPYYQYKLRKFKHKAVPHGISH